MELRHLALVRAAATEHQIFHPHHQLQHSPVVLPSAFYHQPNVAVPAVAAQTSPFSVLPDPCRPPVPAVQPGSAVPVYRTVAPPTSSDFNSRLAPRENPTPEVVERIPAVPESKTRPELTGSRSTTPVKRCHGSSFSIDSLLGTQGSNERLSSGTLEVRKSVAEQIPRVDAEVERGGAGQMSRLHRPISVSAASAPVRHVLPGCTTRPSQLVTLF